MKLYQLTLWQPAGEPPPPEVLEPIMAELTALTAQMRAADAWVFAGGLYGPEASTVIRARAGGDQVLTDGPYVEGKEHIGGFTVVRAADLDAALAWGRRQAEITGLPIEVRPFRWPD